eukprot:CAMPEP_0181326172 /NCGR_PEP_ID=MMETSP1101-20121128/21340_1 /TAXON_ID=46948 /ORGANISM="Rhodomonas abbreviata, Strain Caron Lab Isolate" /LENGTH=133 /DNA_ID=CAMNT_0023434575 /DNA_START=310 /DNA_END=708 /DNA_ORIENTATION=-
MWRAGLAVLFLSWRCAFCAGEDAGFLAEELASTAQRLSSLHPTSELAIPTQAYSAAYADMRPSQPVFSFGPNDGSPMKLALPAFALKQTGTTGQHTALQQQQQRTASARTSQLSANGVDRVMKVLLGGEGGAG